MEIIHLTEQNFEETVKNATCVLIDFWAAWCGPCQMLGPILEEIAKERPDITVAKVNVDEEPELARQFRVMSIPTLVLFKNGEQVDVSVGVQSKDEILEMIGQG